MPYYYEFYCNLNENSIHYNKFALMYDVDMLGEAFSIIEETCIEEILCKYNKMYNLIFVNSHRFRYILYYFILFF